VTAACSCGGTGHHHADTERGRDLAIDDWDRAHAQPLLEVAIPRDVAAAISSARAAITELAATRPAAARQALHGLEQWTSANLDRSRLQRPIWTDGPSLGR
ncbi:MAG: hypothetical protein M3Q68_01770, partial [Actinomycetota bacterium]|nr:hypothetical protein [Actinomycetota bacterium]